MAEEYKSVTGSLTTTAITDVLTVPALTKYLIRSIYIGNIDPALDSGISVSVFKSADSTDRYLIKVALVPIQASLQILTEPLVLEAGDVLDLQAADANVLDYVISYLVIT